VELPSVVGFGLSLVGQSVNNGSYGGADLDVVDVVVDDVVVSGKQRSRVGWLKSNGNLNGWTLVVILDDRYGAGLVVVVKFAWFTKSACMNKRQELLWWIPAFPLFLRKTYVVRSK
jgi:hypothetical protein